MNRKLTAATFILLAGLALGRVGSAQARSGVRWSLDGPPAPAGRWVVEISLRDRSDIDRITEVVEPWAVYPEKGIALAEIDAEEWRELVSEGFELDLDFARTLRLGQRSAPLPGQSAGIPGFPCYSTVEETYAAAEALVAARPDLVRWVDIGDSWIKGQSPSQGFDLRLLEIGSELVAPDAPALLALGGLHAREYATAELVLRFAESLVAQYDRDPDVTWVLDEHRIRLVLQANPDGRKEAEAGKLWRKNKDNLYCSDTDDRGVDLNRNFEFGWGCCGGGSNFECSTTYRGPSGASEPESAAYETLMRDLFPDQRAPDLDAPADLDSVGIFLDIHSFGEDVLWSWGFTTTRPPNDAELYSLGRKLAFFNEYRPQHGSLSTVDGATKDFAYGELGVPGFTIELGTDFFQDCESFESRIAPDNLDMLLYAAKVVRAPYREPSGPDAVDPAVPPRVFFQGEVAELTVMLDDTRYNQSNGVEPSQEIVTAELSIGSPPWSAPRTVPLLPVDGAFDSAVEEAFLPLDTTSLAPGRHTLFVRGMDATGTWGATSAAFLYVAEPKVISQLEGYVRDRRLGRGVAARVDAGPFSTYTDPETGFYRVVLPPEGTWSLEIEPFERHRYPRKGPFEVRTAGRSIVRHEVELDAYSELGELDLRSRGGWLQTSMALGEEGVSTIWSDSLDGPYPPGSERFLTSEPVAVDSYDEAILLFQHAYDFESGFDFGVVEVSRDGGPWETVRRYSGSRSRWESVALPIERLGGIDEVRIRFRAVSDESVEGDGWSLGTPTLVTPDSP